MSVQDFGRLLRRRWHTVAVLAVTGLAIAGVATAATAAVYRASAQVFVSLRDTGGGTSSAYLFSQRRVASYVKIANSPAVTRPVIQRLALDLTPEQLAGRIHASTPPDTVLIDISVRDREPSRARDVANAVAAQFAQVVGSLEAPGRGMPAPVTVTVVRPAELPVTPVAPRPVVNLTLGLVLGLALGIGVATLRQLLDTSLKTTADLQELTGGSALGVIAFDPTAQRAPLVSQVDSRSVRPEAFRTLRTNLRFIDVDHPPRMVVLTSSLADEGRSTTACNLAITMAGAGTRVILVEADLRRPRVADYMGVESGVGLTDVLVGRAGLDDVLQPWGDSPLSVLAGGALPPNPAELLGSAQMTELLAALHARADMVLIDTPPLLPATDAAVLARQCDGALVVIRQGRTTRAQLSRAVAALHGVDARLLGTVLTMAPTGGYIRSDRSHLAAHQQSTGTTASERVAAAVARYHS
jgi:non-specific protein-tyrosine kinase